MEGMNKFRTSNVNFESAIWNFNELLGLLFNSYDHYDFETTRVSPKYNQDYFEKKFSIKIDPSKTWLVSGGRKFTQKRMDFIRENIDRMLMTIGVNADYNTRFYPDAKEGMFLLVLSE